MDPDLAIASSFRRAAHKTGRAARTRQLLLDVVIGILEARGFAALTNAVILEKSGISSGALMHHFPTREKLLIATVEYAYGTLGHFRTAQLSFLDAGLPRFRALIDMSWHTAQMAAGFAVNEVRSGARSDENLAALFRPVFTRVAISHGRDISRLVRTAGLRPDEEMQGLWTATSMTMRSLAIDRRTCATADTAETALLALRLLRERIIAKQLGEQHACDPRVAWSPAS